MKHISSFKILVFCIFLLILSQFTSCKITDCCGIGPYISEVTHYISETHRIKKTNNLIIEDSGPPYSYYKRCQIISRYLSYRMGIIDTNINSNDYYFHVLPYKDNTEDDKGGNTIKYIEYSLIKKKTGGEFYLPYTYKRCFYSGFLFMFSPETEIMATSPNTQSSIGTKENNMNFDSYHYVSIEEPNNGYNLKGYYVKDKTYIPIIEDFYKSVKDTFNLTKIKATATGGPVYPYNIVLLDTIKAINIYCNNDYNDKYKKGSLLNDIMKIVYFNHRPFLQQWHQKSIEDNGATITVSDSDNILFSTDSKYSNYGNDNYTEEWLDEFNAKANTDRLLHPEFLLLGTEDPSEQGEYSFTVEFIYNSGQKIVQETPAFHLLLREFY